MPTVNNGLYWFDESLTWSQCQCSTHERHRKRAVQKEQGFSEMAWRRDRTLKLRVNRAAGSEAHVLLRKEVIQPHLPVRLPCYDFVPIANPTFDSSLRKRLGHWLRVLPTFMT